MHRRNAFFKRRLPALLLALAAIGLASCANKAPAPESVAEQWSFHPPANWVAVPPSSQSPEQRALHMQVWRSPANSLAMVSFAAVKRPDAKPTVLPAGIRAVGSQQLCGHTATLLQLQTPTGITADDVYMQLHDMRAASTYFYPHGTKADPQAEAAIRSICPIETASAEPSPT